jgi:hypothetical protein
MSLGRVLCPHKGHYKRLDEKVKVKVKTELRFPEVDTRVLTYSCA